MIFLLRFSSEKGHTFAEIGRYLREARMAEIALKGAVHLVNDQTSGLRDICEV